MDNEGETLMQDDNEPNGGVAELMRLLGTDDISVLDVDRLWADRGSSADERWGVVPVGVTSDGELQELVFRPKDLGGFGVHSVVIGSTGSGKSTFFESLVYWIALTHAPETFNVVFVDVKAPSVAAHIAGLPHVVGTVDGLAVDGDDKQAQMRLAISQELERRCQLFGSVGARDATEYEEMRLAGRDLEPVPILLVAIDDYTYLFETYPAWIDLVATIGQQGRCANIYFMLGGQRLDLRAAPLQKIKSNIAFRIALRTVTTEDSRQTIGSDAACFLPGTEPGQALLAVGHDDLRGFRAFDMSVNDESGRRITDVLRELLAATGRTAPRQLLTAAG